MKTEFFFLRAFMGMLCGLVVWETSALAQNKDQGFITLMGGRAQYAGGDGIVQEEASTGAQFLLRIHDDYRLYLGAMTFASFSLDSHTITDVKPTEEVDTTVTMKFQHRAYGSILAYVYATDTRLAFQFWGGGGYFNNIFDIKTTLKEEITRSNGVEAYQCAGETVNQQKTASSLPAFVGIGFTAFDFGVFAQYLVQKLPDIQVAHSSQFRCPLGSTVENRLIEKSTNIGTNLEVYQVGIQYRF